MKREQSLYLKQTVGNRDTKHGLLDLPVAGAHKMKKPRMRFAAGGESTGMIKKELDFFKKKGAPKSMIRHEAAELRGAKRFAGGGDVELADEEGNTFSDLEKKGKNWTTSQRGFRSMTQAERAGRRAGVEDYPREKRVQESLGQPARALRKGATWLREQYGDARDSVSGALSGDPEHGEFRRGQQAIRKRELGYAKGGTVRCRDGCAVRGRTKGRMV